MKNILILFLEPKIFYMKFYISKRIRLTKFHHNHNNNNNNYNHSSKNNSKNRNVKYCNKNYLLQRIKVLKRMEGQK